MCVCVIGVACNPILLNEIHYISAFVAYSGKYKNVWLLSFHHFWLVSSVMPFQKYLIVADILFSINCLVKTGDRMDFISSVVLIHSAVFHV